MFMRRFEKVERKGSIVNMKVEKTMHMFPLQQTITVFVEKIPHRIRSKRKHEIIHTPC